jgi:hypothetical protein
VRNRLVELLASAAIFLPGTVVPGILAAEVELIDATTPWRAYLTLGAPLRRDAEGLNLGSPRLRLVLGPDKWR